MIPLPGAVASPDACLSVESSLHTLAHVIPALPRTEAAERHGMRRVQGPLYTLARPLRAAGTGYSGFGRMVESASRAH